MKKYIFSVIALAASLVGCTGDYTDWASPISNAQPETVTFGDGSVTEVGLIDFSNEAVASAAEVPVCKITAPTASDPNYSPMPYKLYINGTVFENIEEDGNLSTTSLKNYVENTYGKAPVERDMDAYLEQWITNGTTAVKTATSSVFKIKVKLDAPKISANYYVVGGTLDWAGSAASKEQKFTHSANNVYDDPVFTITIPAKEGEDTWFAIGDDEALDAVTTGDWSKLLGTTGDSYDLKGNLKTRSELGGDHSLCVSAGTGAKYIKITINMMEGSYTIEPISFQPYIYYVGTANGWNNTAEGVSQKLALTDANNGTYAGYIYCKEESYGNTFRFLKTYGDWNDTYGNPNVTSYDGPMEAGSSDGNFNATAGTGLYYVELSIGAGTMKAVKVNKMGIIGNFNGWGDDVDMTWDADNFCYTVSNPGITADGWKFRVNAGWDLNLGGSLDNLINNGDNLSAVGNTVKLYPCRTTNNNIYCTVE